MKKRNIRKLTNKTWFLSIIIALIFFVMLMLSYTSEEMGFMESLGPSITGSVVLYFIVWSIIWINKYIKSNKLLKKARECAEIVNTTMQPESFAVGYNNLIHYLSKLTELEKSIKFKGEMPSSVLDRVVNGREENTGDFIKRSYQEMIKSIKWSDGISEWTKIIDDYFLSIDMYIKDITQENILLIDDLKKQSEESKNHELLNKAISLCSKGQPSVSLLQRYLRVGYKQAISIYDKMREMGLIDTSLQKKVDVVNTNLQKELINIDCLKDGYAFENYIAKLLKSLFYTNIKITSSTGDYGIDVLASKEGIKYAIQCKLYSQPVSNKAVQEAYSGKDYYNCHVAIVVTNSTFTNNAKILAAKTGVILWDRDVLSKLLLQAGFTIK